MGDWDWEENESAVKQSGGSVHRQLMELGNSVKHLAALVDKMETRLGGVLRPNATKTELKNDVPREAVGSPLADQLKSNTEAVSRIVRHLSAIDDRIDL